ncbi:hypothetical protein AB0F18_37885 [Streptomyces sp. NPDC029216]
MANGYWVSVYRAISDPERLAYESEAYQKALVVLSDGVERDFRIIEGLD